MSLSVLCEMIGQRMAGGGESKGKIGARDRQHQTLASHYPFQDKVIVSHSDSISWSTETGLGVGWAVAARRTTGTFPGEVKCLSSYEWWLQRVCLCHKSPMRWAPRELLGTPVCHVRVLAAPVLVLLPSKAHLWRKQVMSLAPPTHIADVKGVPNSWLWPGSVWAVLDIWENEQMNRISLSVCCLFLSIFFFW